MVPGPNTCDAKAEHTFYHTHTSAFSLSPSDSRPCSQSECVSEGCGEREEEGASDGFCPSASLCYSGGGLAQPERV